MTNPQEYNMSYGQSYVPHITTTPVVKSHSMIYSPHHYQQQDTNYNFIESNNLTMDFDYFDHVTAPPNNANHGIVAMDTSVFNHKNSNIYSPSINSVTTNSSAMMIDTALSPVSPINLMSPTSHIMNLNSPMDTFVAPINTPYMMAANNTNNLFQQPIQNEQQSFDRKAKRSLPRRHTVSTPYNTNMVEKGKEMAEKPIEQPATTKTHIYSQRDSSSTPPPIPDMKELSLWSHEELLQRVIELEKEKEVAMSVAQNSILKDDGVLIQGNTTALHKMPDKVRSSSPVDNSKEEVEDDAEDDEDEEMQTCQWENCIEEFITIEELINHVKDDHIGSGKTQYYCCWKDCARQQKPFTKRHKMHNHLRTHTGERPFVCTEPDEPPTTTVVVQSTALQPDNLFMAKQDLYSDWAMSTQAAVLNVMDRAYI
ncbi:hypothetical protein G6F43_006390 [Rhizopus delemar]|nr:hypothetical protein G6F43_006390 [Rhizopus delemar]